MTAATYRADDADRWLHGPDPNGSQHEPGTVAEHLGVNDDWPGTGCDSRDHAVIDLAEAAFDADIIVFADGIDDVELITVVDSHGIHAGIRLTVTDDSNRTVIGPTLSADDLTGEATGHTAALAALADQIDETAAQLAPLPMATPDGHRYRPWTDGHAIGFAVTSPTGRRELLYLNPSSDSDDGIATITIYHAAAGEPADQHQALNHVDLLTTACPGCSRPIADTTVDCHTCRAQLTGAAPATNRGTAEEGQPRAPHHGP